MKKIINKFRQFIAEEDGQSTAEYVLILAIVVMVVLQFKKVFVEKIETSTNKLGGGIDRVLEQMDDY